MYNFYTIVVLLIGVIGLVIFGRFNTWSSSAVTYLNKDAEAGFFTLLYDILEQDTILR